MSNSIVSSSSIKSQSPVKAWVIQHQLASFFTLSYAIMYAAVFGAMQFKIPFYGPVWFLAIFSPTISALIVSAVTGGMGAVRKLLQGYTRWNAGGRWYLAALFLLALPVAVALIYQALGNPVRGLAPGMTTAALIGQFIFTFFSGPFAEEGGWRGFALPRLQGKYNALVSSVILGVLWTCWHIPMYFYPLPSTLMIFPVFIVINTVLTVIMTWLYNNTRGSLVITILAHFCFNLVGGFVTGTLGMMPMNIFLMVAVPGLALWFLWIVIYFGPKYLSRKPLVELPFEPRF